MRRPGLGVVENKDGSFYVPDWCAWMPFSSFNDACKLPTPDQVRRDDLSNLGPAADPQRVAVLRRQWEETERIRWQQDPEQYAEYLYAMEHPDLSAAIGTGSIARGVTRTAAAVDDLFKSSTNWPMYLLLFGGGLLVLSIARNRR